MFKSDFKPNTYPQFARRPDSLSNWSHTNVILLIESKPAHLHFGKEFRLHTYTLNGSNITTTNCIKDLGLGIYLSTKVNSM